MGQASRDATPQGIAGEMSLDQAWLAAHVRTWKRQSDCRWQRRLIVSCPCRSDFFVPTPTATRLRFEGKSRFELALSQLGTFLFLVGRLRVGKRARRLRTDEGGSSCLHRHKSHGDCGLCGTYLGDLEGGRGRQATHGEASFPEQIETSLETKQGKSLPGGFLCLRFLVHANKVSQLNLAILSEQVEYVFCRE